MAFCTSCGSPLDEGVKFCTNCGAAVEEAAPAVAPEAAPAPAQESLPPFEQQPQQAPSYQQPQQAPGYQQPSPQPTFAPAGDAQAAPVDTGNIGWGILGFFIPLVGFILFFVWRNTKPQSARVSLIGAVIGLCLGILLQFMG